MKLAQYVLQFVFTSHTGFKFLVANWPTCEATAPELFEHLMEVLSTLHMYEFKVCINCLPRLYMLQVCEV